MRKDGSPYEALKEVGARLETSLDNLSEARTRGYPFGFTDKGQYKGFMAKVTGSLDKRKIPSADVRVHGSAIHSKTPGDIDVSVIVDEATFNGLAAKFKSGAKDDANALKALTADIGKGKISSSNFYPDAKPSAAAEVRLGRSRWYHPDGTFGGALERRYDENGDSLEVREHLPDGRVLVIDD